MSRVLVVSLVSSSGVMSRRWGRPGRGRRRCRGRLGRCRRGRPIRRSRRGWRGRDGELPLAGRADIAQSAQLERGAIGQRGVDVAEGPAVADVQAGDLRPAVAGAGAQPLLQGGLGGVWVSGHGTHLLLACCAVAVCLAPRTGRFGMKNWRYGDELPCSSPDEHEQRAATSRGRGLLWTGTDAHTGIYGSEGRSRQRRTT